MMLTLRQLLNATNSFKDKLFKNANKVSVSFNSKNKALKDPRGFYLDVSGKAITREPGKRPHKFQFRLYYDPKKYIPPSFREENKVYTGPDKPKPFTLDSKIWVSCSCEYYKYYCEVANAERDNSSVLYSNGKAPVITNPNHIPQLCKHLISAAKKGILTKKERPAPTVSKKGSKYIPPRNESRRNLK